MATDVYPPPKMVKKLATTLNSKIYSPSKLLTVDVKKEMVDDYLKSESITLAPENAHQRDALAAAIKTYKYYEKKLKHIENKVSSFQLNDDEVDEIKCLVINGTPITKAIDSFMTKKSLKNSPETGLKDKYVSKTVPKTRTRAKKVIDHYRDQTTQDAVLRLKNRIKRQETQIKNQEAIIKNLRDRNKLLKNKIQKQKRKTSKLQSKLDKLYFEYSQDILHDKEIYSKIKLIKNLQEKCNQEKALRKKLEENLNTLRKMNNMGIAQDSVPVKIVKSFTKEGIREASNYWKIKKGDVILLSSSEGGGSQTASLIVQIGVKAIITRDSMSHQATHVLEEANIPIISADRLEIKNVDEFAIIKAETLNNEIEKWKINVEQVRKKAERQKLLKVIDEYKAKRKREPFNE